MEVEHVQLTERGFRVRFTRPVDTNILSKDGDFLIERYYYRYDASYGSPKLGVEAEAASNMRIMGDGNEIQFEIERLEPGYIYEMDFSEIENTNRVKIMNPNVAYTLQQL